MGDEIKITIQRGEGISQAIKRQLISDGANNTSFTGNVWAQIQQALQGDATDENTNNNSTFTHNGETKNIGDAWTQLNMNVKIFAGDELTISDETWATIKGLFVESSGQGQSVQEEATKKAPKTNNGAETQPTQGAKKAEKTPPQQPVQNNGNSNTQTVKSGTGGKYQQEFDIGFNGEDTAKITVKANSQKALKNKITQLNKMKTLYENCIHDYNDPNFYALQAFLLKAINTGDKDMQVAAAFVAANADCTDEVFDKLLATKEPEVIGRIASDEYGFFYNDESKANELYALTKDNDFMAKCGEDAGWIKGEITYHILGHGHNYPNFAKEIYKNSSHAMRSYAKFEKTTINEIMNDKSYNLNPNDMLYLYHYLQGDSKFNTKEIKFLLSKLPKNLTYWQVYLLNSSISYATDKYAKRNFVVVDSGETIDDTIARHVLNNNIYKKLTQESDAECRALAIQIGYTLQSDKKIASWERDEIYTKAQARGINTKWSPEQRMQAAKKYAKTYRSAITNKIGLNSKTKTWYGRKTFADLQHGQVIDFSAMNNAWPQPTKIL